MIRWVSARSANRRRERTPLSASDAPGSVDFFFLSLKKVRAPVMRRRQAPLSEYSTRLICHRCWNILRYSSMLRGSSTVSSGAETLYSSVKTSHPSSPWVNSSMRASSRRSVSGWSADEVEPRRAVSSVAVRLWR